MTGTYVRAITTHTLAGVAIAGAVGALIGALGGAVPIAPSWSASCLLLGILATALWLHQLGRLGFPIPQLPRQTQKLWYGPRGPVHAAWWWGLDLGSGLTTLINFPIYWILPAAIFFFGSTVGGALILAAYALGRAVAVWLPPILIGGRAPLREVPLALVRHQPLMRQWQAHILAILAAALLVRSAIAM